MRYLKIVMLLLAVTVGTQAYIIPVPPALARGGETIPSWSPPRACSFERCRRGLSSPCPLLQLLVVQRIEDGGVPHLVDGSLAPVHVMRWLVRISRILFRVVPRGRELDPRGSG